MFMACSQALKNWEELQIALREMTEEQCWKLLKQETNGKDRLQYKMRIYGRANTLRCERERRELAAR
jgi:hypothetical protein